MTRFTTARRTLSMVALSIVAVTAAACSSAPLAGVGQPAAQTRIGADANSYACYYADKKSADRVVEGRTVHWCGPVPRPVN
jgi:hypothetical protein